MILTKRGLNRMPILIAAAAFCAVMLDLCEDRSSCSVLASPETFTEDPCVGTPKYLEVHYKCRPDQFEHLTVCEDEEMEISCSRGQRIAVYSAMFGRTQNGSEKCPSNKQEFVDCQASGTLPAISALCHGKRNCAVVANQSVFGEPCASGINTYLSVSYTCVPRKFLKQLHHRANKKKRKKKKKKRKKMSELHDEVANFTTESGRLEDTSNEPLSDHAFQSSSEVYETFEKQSVTHFLSVRESSKEEMEQQQLMKEFTNESLDVTTVQDEAVAITSDDINTEAPSLADYTITYKYKYSHNISESTHENIGSGESQYDESDEFTKPAVLMLNHNISDDNQSLLNGQDTGNNNDNNNQNVTDNNSENASIKNNDVQLLNQTHNIKNHSDISGSSVDVDEASDYTPTSLLDSTSTPFFLNSTVGPDSDKSQETDLDSIQTANPNKINIPESHYVTERNLTVLCINYTRPDFRWVELVRSKNENTIGFLRDWFSVIHYLQIHQEKAWLYFTLGVCFGIIVMLVVILIKVCINFHRNIRARLDVSEPTHRNTHTNNHSSLDAPMLEHSDSVDRIEVVRFSPRNTLRSQRSNSHHRDLVNYYG